MAFDEIPQLGYGGETEGGLVDQANQPQTGQKFDKI